MWTSYDTLTGKILATMTDRKSAGKNAVIAGSWSASKYYIKANRAWPYPPKPGAGTWQWDLATETWQFDAEKTARELRASRDRALESVDRVNPMWWASLSPERQTQLQAYRQALLDLPQQPGWPMQVIWPERPRWL